MNWSNNSTARHSRVLQAGRLLTFAVLVALLPAGAHAKDKKKKPKGDADSKYTDIPIPVNHDAKGVKIPSYDPAGKLQMYFNIDTAFRVDERHLKMANLKIETFDEAGKSDMLIDMPASMLDLKTRIISSVDPVTIHRADFEVVGGNMTFNTQTRQGKFEGPVRMLIFNHEDLNQSGGETPANE